MRDAGFDVSFRDCPAKGGTGGHPSCKSESVQMLLTSLGAYKSVPRQSRVNALSVALPNGGISNQLHLHLPVPFSIDWNFVRFPNTSYKFSLLVFEFTKTRDVPGSFPKKGTFRGHKSESGDCPRETGTSGNPNLVTSLDRKEELLPAFRCRKLFGGGDLKLR
jgi:hypothetical protein